MAKETTSDTTMEVLAKGRTLGKFRCVNCFERITAPHGSKTIKCPKCGFEWRVSWIDPKFPRIRGPVWEVNRRLAAEEISKMGKGVK